MAAAQLGEITARTRQAGDQPVRGLDIQLAAGSRPGTTIDGTRDLP